MNLRTGCGARGIALAAEGVQDAARTPTASGPGSDPVAGTAPGVQVTCRWAASTSEAPWVAKPTRVCKTRTQGAYPLGWRRRGF